MGTMGVGEEKGNGEKEWHMCPQCFLPPCRASGQGDTGKREGTRWKLWDTYFPSTGVGAVPYSSPLRSPSPRLSTFRWRVKPELGQERSLIKFTRDDSSREYVNMPTEADVKSIRTS